MLKAQLLDVISTARVYYTTMTQETSEHALARRLRDRIQLARQDAGLSQEELAKAIALDSTAVSKIESGTRSVSSVELTMLARECGKSLDWFFSEEAVAGLNFRGNFSSSEAMMWLGCLNSATRITTFEKKWRRRPST